MTDRISTGELHHAALARRFYHHVFHGGSLTADDVSIMVQTIEELEAEVVRLREALEPFAEAADGRKSKNISGSHCFGQAHLLKARAALNHKETE